MDNVRQRNPVGVPLLIQQKDYSKTFHKIDKVNGAEPKYDMGGNRYVYDWIELLIYYIIIVLFLYSYFYFSIFIQQVSWMDTQAYLPILKYEFEQCLPSLQDITQKHSPKRRMMTILDAMKEATYALLQTGEKMPMVDAVHPPYVRNMTNAYDSTARAFQSDYRGGTIGNNNV